MSVDSAKQAIVEAIDSLRDEILATSRHLHDHPELSGEEVESAKLLASRAEKQGFAVEHDIAGLPTAFRALYGKPGSGPRIAFLAEYDALPVVGHGCGHNIIGTVSTYAAIGLAAAAKAGHFKGEVALFGTPAEETFGGKINMLEAGVFDGVSAALMCHPGIYTEVAYSSLACISVVVEFFGKSAHAAASPWKGINALDAMIQLFVTMDQRRKQLPPTAKSPGVILKGGERANMVPDYAKGQFSLRGKDKEESEKVLECLIACGQAAAQSTGARFEWHMDGNPYFDMRPDPKLADEFREVWKDLGGDTPIEKPVPHGSLDIANLSHRFPCLHPSIKITNDETVGGHTHEFAAATVSPLAEEQILRAAKALAVTARKIEL
ncbi:MAG: amidohydrolase [Candidatus Sumerlaeaceae bacterium]|nr:amidohydrolase [Candidatus Sumerlaeaceae bacterium]